MLWIFDVATECGDDGRLLLDGLVSLLRQWILRSGLWKFPAAVLASLVQIAFLGLLFAAFRHPIHSFYGSLTPQLTPTAFRTAIELILGVSGAIVVMVLAATVWATIFLALKIRRTGQRAGRSNAASIIR